MSDHRWPSPNHNYVPEFQLSGIPYAKSATVADGETTTFEFDHLTRWIAISSDQDVQLGFNHDDAIHDNYYFTCKSGMTQRFELKCKKIVIKNASGNAATVSVLAGLTNINSSTFPNQTNANGFIVQ